MDDHTSCVRTCVGCGAVIIPGPRERNKRKWCSGRCRLAYKRATDLEYVERCRVVGRERARKARAERKAHPKPVVLTCKTCGKSFESMRRGVAYCSDSCRYRNFHRTRKDRIKANGRQPYLLSDVAARDLFTCCLCGERVDMTLTYPDPGSASVDHVVPLARGGADVFDNVQLSHIGCNWAKGDRVTEEVVSLFAMFCR